MKNTQAQVKADRSIPRRNGDYQPSSSRVFLRQPAGLPHEHRPTRPVFVLTHRVRTEELRLLRPGA